MKTLLLSFCLACCATGFAQTPAQPAAPAAPAKPAASAASAASFSESHRKAAGELLDAMNMQATLDAAIDAQLEAQMTQMPQLASVEGVMRDFFRKYMSYDAMRDDYVDLYASVYTEKELRELKKFYATPLGQKMVATMPEVTARSTKLGQEVVAEHMMELQQAIMAKMQEGSNN